MSELVKQVLEQSNLTSGKYLTADVSKDVAPDIDVGHLMITDQEPIKQALLRDSKEYYLQHTARDNTQLLINQIWELPVEKVDNIIVAKLPKPRTVICREKPIPKPKAPTKWEKYAKLKGIQNKKKGRKQWDEAAKEWRPSWGYRRAGDPADDWMLEVPDHAADPNEDQFGKRVARKRELVAKNELQRLRNIVRSGGRGKRVPGVGVTPVEKPSKNQLTKALSVAKSSTPSLGKFSEKVAKEPTGKIGVKRKFNAVTGDLKAERQRQLEILDKSLKKKPKMNVTMAVNKQMREEQTQSRKSDVATGKAQKRSKGKKKVASRNAAAAKGKHSGRNSASHGGKGKKGGGSKKFNVANKMKTKSLGKKKK